MNALKEAGASPERVHINAFVRGEKKLKDYKMLVVPGGFSFGDDIASGKVLANKLLHQLKAPLQEFLAAKKPIIGICNGFQVLVKCGLLPGTVRQTGATPSGDGVSGWDGQLRATLTNNDSGKFECRWIYLQPAKSKSLFAKGLPSVFPLPVAHGEGKFVPESDKFYKQLLKNGQIVFRYVDAKGKKPAYPWNPNGSHDDVAGICNAEGNVLGLMPHPERNVFGTQSAFWTRKGGADGYGPGFIIFQNAVRYAEKI
jgi:phosphoribosylformylglycinamidine synthase